jgi:hypothetical protein
LTPQPAQLVAERRVAAAEDTLFELAAQTQIDAGNLERAGFSTCSRTAALTAERRR